MFKAASQHVRDQIKRLSALCMYQAATKLVTHEASEKAACRAQDGPDVLGLLLLKGQERRTCGVQSPCLLK